MVGLDTTRGYRVARATALCCLSTLLRAIISRVIYRSSTNVMGRCFVIVILMNAGNLRFLPNLQN